jgi:hypothetical protein
MVQSTWYAASATASTAQSCYQYFDKALRNHCSELARLFDSRGIRPLHVQYASKMQPDRAGWPVQHHIKDYFQSTARSVPVCSAANAQSGSQQHCWCCIQKPLIQKAAHRAAYDVLQTSCAAFSSASGRLRRSTGDLDLLSASPRRPHVVQQCTPAANSQAVAQQ